MYVGLPDGIVVHKTFQFGYVLRAFKMETLVYFISIWYNFGQLVNVMASWYNFWSFGMSLFPPFW
jgi:hypothetical protein